MSGTAMVATVDTSQIVIQLQNSNQILGAIQQQLAAGVGLIPGKGFYDLIGYWRGQLPADAAPVHRLEMVRTVTLSRGLTTSVASCIVAPTDGTAMLVLKVNSNSVGSISFAVGSKVGAFSFPNDVSMSAGDIWEVDPPSPQDSSFASVSWTIVGSA